MENKIKNVLVLQIDNRNKLDYLGLTKKSIIQSCNHLSNAIEYKNNKIQNTKYHYMFLEMNPYLKPGQYPATAKIYAMYEILNTTTCDAIVFLDSDAWIQEPKYLYFLMNKLENSSYQGAYSRDPYLKKNTYINSGSFVLLVNDYTRKMYKTIIENMKIDQSHLWKHAYDQYYISNYVYENRNDFMVFKPHIMNTPDGRILRHNWWKNHKMYRDLYDLLDESYIISVPSLNDSFNFEIEFEDQGFPNTIENGYEYR
jgi:hypothetical protein